MSKKNIDLTIYETKGFLYDKNFKIDELEKYCSKKINDIIFTFEHPLKYNILPKNKIKIGFLVYEFTTLPESWIENINKYIDLVLVPSKFTYDVFLKSGINRNKIKILRYGYNPKYYYPSDPSKTIRNFLTITSPHRREALDILLKGFKKAFEKKDDVKLIIKTSYIPFKKIKNFEITNFLDLIKSYKNSLGSKIEIITENLSETEMGELYRKSDIYISISKAESFGLPFIESLACGRGCISLKYSGQTDFLNDKNTIFIKHKIVKADLEVYEKTQEEQYIAEAELEDLISKLNLAYEKGFKPIIDKEELEKYQWDFIVEDFIEIIKSFI